MVVQQTYFNHKGGSYYYRVHNDKLGLLCNGNGFVFLADYLSKIFKECPHEYFNRGPRGSMLKFALIDNILSVGGHEVSSLARYGLEINKERYRDKHSKVQMFMLENDRCTVAMEVPIWLNPEELACYESVFKSKERLTGHIDILRVDDGKVWVWDFKPGAEKEKYAATQVFFYSYMLSKRTGIPLNKFRCGYFDQNYAFVFEPKEELLLKLTNQKKLI